MWLLMMPMPVRGGGMLMPLSVPPFCCAAQLTDSSVVAATAADSAPQFPLLLPSYPPCHVLASFLSLEYTPRYQYRNKEGWALVVPLAAKSALKLRPCSQG